MDMELVDLFCGGGGSSTGYHAAGFKTTFAVDKEYHCINTFNANHGNVARQLDISELRSEVISKQIKNKPTLVTASPPCEPYTSANENRIKDPIMRMFDDPIGRLMIHAIRLIADLEPEFYTIENVAGILQGENKSLLKEEFNRVGLGDPVFNVIEAADWGIPSHRLRVIISNKKLTVPNLPRKTVMDAIGDLPEPNYPHEFEDHITIPVPKKHQKKLVTLPQGEGLVYFRGANKQYVNYKRLYPNEPAPVVMGKSSFFHPFEDRLLTPREHARLMTFPDDYKFIGGTTQVYDIIGEAVPPYLTQQIGEQFISKM